MHSENFDFMTMVDRADNIMKTHLDVDVQMPSAYKSGFPFISMKRFLEDPYYMGKIAKDLYPGNKPDLIDIFDNGHTYIEVILTGATSIGKTFMTALAMTYMIAQIGSFKDPHRWLGASPASPIVMVNMSLSAQKAREVIFTRVKTMVDTSPYFREKMPRDMRLTDSLVWRLSGEEDDRKQHTGPQLLFKPGTGDSLSALGDDIFAGAGDELNFFRIIEKSKRAYGEALDPAQRLYDVISRRMKGRFSSGGLPLGKFFLLSSAQYPDDFIERRIREAEAAGELGKTIKVIRKSIWEAKSGVYIQGAPVFCGKTFRVEVGSTRRGSRLLDKYDKTLAAVVPLPFDDKIDGKVIDPPIELYDDFSRDVEGSVRDFGGEVTRAISPFFNDSEPIYAAIYPGLRHPWSKEETTLEDGSGLDVAYMFTYDENEKRQRPARHPNKPRYIHVDLGKTSDACGLGVVHIADWVINMRSGQKVIEPVYELDMALRIVPPRGDEIKFDRVLDVIRILRHNGMTIRKVTYDTWQSSHSIQKLRAEGLDADEQSTVKDISPYILLRDAFYDKRIRIYSYDILIAELMRLEKKGDKVDHPATGSKDCADALCGAVWSAFIQEAKRSGDMAVMPTVIHRENPMKTKSEIERDKAMKTAEEEMREFMGGSTIVR